jgi:hypothetical protein
MIDYKYNENNALCTIKDYIDSTYTQHYSGKYQATDMIIDAGHGTGFCIGNIMKYAKRYGKKDGLNKADLLKIIHYAIIQLHVHEMNQPSKKNEIKQPKVNSIPANYVASCYRGYIIETPDDLCHACDCWKSKTLTYSYTT